MNLELRKEMVSEVLHRYELTKKQKEAMNMFIELCDNKFEGSKRIVFSGKGGVGKSLILTLMSEIATLYRLEWNACCYTGKGTNVLRERGVKNTSTIHGMMYVPRVNFKGQLIGFNKRDNLNYDLIFVDEFSMLDEELILNLEEYNIPVIYFGDAFQLPPVKKEKTYLEPYITLEFDEVVRQAEGSPIIKFANYVRDKNRIPYGIVDSTEKGKFIVLSQKRDKDIIDKIKYEVSQIIVGTNKLRNSINIDYRKNLNYDSLIVVGEKLSILKNSQYWGVFNGQDIVVKEILSEEYEDDMGIRCVKILTEDDFEVTISTEILYDYTKEPNKMYNKRKDKDYNEPIFVDYSYAKSCYKVQGSEYDSVMIFASSLWWMNIPNEYKNEAQAWEHYCRGIYTSISRSKKECYMILP